MRVERWTTIFFLSAADEKNVELFAITQQQQFRMRKKNRETGEKSEIDYIICAQFFVCMCINSVVKMPIERKNSALKTWWIIISMDLIFISTLKSMQYTRDCVEKWLCKKRNNSKTLLFSQNQYWASIYLVEIVCGAKKDI